MGSPAFTGSASPRRPVWIAVVGLIGLAAIAVVAIVVLSSSGSDNGAVYRHKLSSVLAPVVATNEALSTSLQSLGGSTSSATSAANQAQQAVVSARGAMAVLTVPSSSAQLSQQVQQALTAEDGYLRAVSATLSAPSAENISQLQPLATTTQSALVPLAGLAPGASTSLAGTDKLSSWASGRVAAAARASTAAARAAQQHAVQQAASKAASQAAQQAVSNSTSSGSSSPAATPSPGVQDLPVQCGYGVAGSSGMSCPFAENAFYQYWSASSGDPALPESIYVWSAEGQTWYALSCSSGDGVVDCTGRNSSGVPLDARFSQSALSAYTTSQAAAYAASGKLGP